MTKASRRPSGNTRTAARITLAWLLLCALSWIVSPVAHAAGEPLPMWEIRSTASKGAVYLLGSVHVCRESCLRFPESVMRRFRSSKALALELDPTRPEVATRMAEATTLPAGQTLQGKLSTTQSRKLQIVLDELGLPAQALQSLRPIMAATLISTLAAQKQGLTMQDGIDVWFLRQAQDNRKPVRELETIDRQLAALTGGSESDEVTSLMETLDMISNHLFGPYIEELVRTWQSGNLETLSQLMQESLGNSKGLEEALIHKRNIEMADKLALWLSRGEEIFVVIGAAHIAGPGNVAQLLERKGFSIRQLHDGE